MKINKLTEKENAVIVDKGTEPAFSGKYDNFFRSGKYVCKRCDALLFCRNQSLMLVVAGLVLTKK